MYELFDAIENQYNNGHKRSFKRRDTKRILPIYKEINSAFISFIDNMNKMDDINYWNLDRLDRGSNYERFRKPKITISLYITSAGNLVMEWLPTIDENGDNDFFYNIGWLQMTPPFKEPHNRLFRINKFNYFKTEYNEKKVSKFEDKIDRYIDCICSHLTEDNELEHESEDEIRKELNRIVSYLDKDLKNCMDDFISKIITLLERKFEVIQTHEIYNCESETYLLRAEDAHKIKHDKYVKSWIKSEIVDDLGIGPEELINLFNENEKSYAKTTRALNLKVPSNKISASKLRNRIIELKELKGMV